MEVNFELYKVFYQVSSARSFSIAAERLFISQSAVSQNIKNLEQKLGVQLFLRKGRELKLTREGEWLYGHVQQAYNLFKTAESKINEFNNLETGEVRIGASDTVCRYFLLPYLQKFNRMYPKVKIHFVNRTSSQLREILKEGSIDFSVVTLRAGEEGENIRVLTTVEDVFVASSRFSPLKGRITPLKELASYPLLMLEKTSTTRESFEQFLREKSIDLQPEMELESMDLLVEFAKIGLGVAYVLKDSIQEAVYRSLLFIVRTEEKLPIRRLGLITRDRVPVSQSAGRFMSLIAGETE